MAQLIGIDIGPTEVAALAVDADDGEVRSRARTTLSAHPSGTVHPDPHEVFAATKETLHKLVAGLERPHEVRAIGLSGTPVPVLLDRARQSTTTFEQAVTVVPIKDYVGLCLTGVLATDVTEARDGLPAPLTDLAWPPSDACAALRGALSEEVARSVHLADGIPVVRGATRVVARMIGVGATSPTVAAAWLEQDAVLALGRQARSSLPKDSGVAVLHHALPNQDCVVARRVGAGGMLDWYCDVLCDGERMAAELRRTTVREIVLEAASTSRPGGGGVVFTGDSLVGLTATASKADLSRALIEGAAFALRDCLRAVGEATAERSDAASPVQQVRLGGPWAQSAFFRQLLADVLNVEVVAAHPDAAMLGAAVFAAVGVHARPSVEQVVEAWIRPKGAARSEPATSARYRDVAAIYDELRASLSGPHARLAKLP